MWVVYIEEIRTYGNLITLYKLDPLFSYIYKDPSCNREKLKIKKHYEELEASSELINELKRAPRK